MIFRWPANDQNILLMYSSAKWSSFHDRGEWILVCDSMAETVITQTFSNNDFLLKFAFIRSLAQSKVYLIHSLNSYLYNDIYKFYILICWHINLYYDPDVSTLTFIGTHIAFLFLTLTIVIGGLAAISCVFPVSHAVVCDFSAISHLWRYHLPWWGTWLRQCGSQSLLLYLGYLSGN